jgi:lysozyme
MSQLYGVDVSSFQGIIDWDALNAASNFVIMRAGYGTEPDQQFQRNQGEARRVRVAAGPLGVGYYYFAYPTLLSAVDSAIYFVDQVGPLQEGEILVLDLEGNVGPDPVGWSLAWLQKVEAETGVKPLIYLNQSEEQSYNWGPVVANGNGLWLAKYDGNKTSIPLAAHWSVVALKQWTDADTVAGISGKVDGDMFNGGFDQFYAYGFHAPATSTPPPVDVPPTPSQPTTPPPVEPSPAPTPPVETPPTPTPTPTPPPVITPQPTSWWQKFLAFLRKWL